MKNHPGNSTPLPTLISHALHAFVHDYERPGKKLPSLPELNIVLRVIGSRGVEYKQLGKLCILSERVVRISIRHLESDRWLTINPSGEGAEKLIQLTAAGKTARTQGRRRQSAVERDWDRQFGNKHMQDLRSTLESIVAQVDVELPHHIVSYGQGDPSITGGGYHPAEAGPPRIPAHGGEWPVVIRKAGAGTNELPLTTLLSQALSIFTIDYDEDVETVMGGLHGVTTFLQFVGDDGMPLSKASKIADVKGNGRAALERHQLVTVKASTGARSKQRTVFLTPLGRKVCDRYPERVFEIERQWRNRFGPKTVDRLRAELEFLDQRLEGNLPDYVETRGWIQRRR